MSSSIRILIPLLLGVLLNTIALAEQNTLIPLWLHKADISTWQIGIVTSAYYGGILAGTLLCGRMVMYLGFARSYQLFCVFFVLCSSGLWLPEHLLTWGMTRFWVGFTCAGIWVAIESWLLTLGKPQERGGLLAVYMVVLYLGTVIGQLMLDWTGSEFIRSMFWMSGLMLLGAIPMFIVPNEKMQRPPDADRKPLWQVITLPAARIGMLGCLLSGIVLGIVYGLLPLFLTHIKMSDAEVGRWMALLISAAIVGQLPIGKLADKYGRHRILLLQVGLIILCSIWLMFFSHAHWLLAIALVSFGFAAFTLYPIAMALASEKVAKHELVAMEQALLVSYTVGSLIGPLAGSLMIEWVGFGGLFALIALVNVFFMVILMRVPRAARD